MNVFIADDDRIIVQGLRKMILDLNDGFTVIGLAYNEEDALEKLLSSDVDLLITDIKMPIMDGLELIQKIKLHKPEIRIIVLSGFDEYHFIRSSLKGGATDYLLKPINRDEFYDVLQGLRKECEDHTSIEEQQVPHSQQSEAPNVNSIIKKAKGYIHQNYQKKISLETVAEYVGLSECYFSSLFKSKTGMRFYDYLCQVRMESAKQMLRTNLNLKIYEIALNVGYPEVVSFNRNFKKYTGVSPKEYRENYLTYPHE